MFAGIRAEAEGMSSLKMPAGGKPDQCCFVCKDDGDNLHRCDFR